MLLRYLLGRESVPRCAQARIDGALNARHEALPVAAHGTPTSAEASHIQQRTQMRSLPQGRHEPYASAHAGASACPAASLGRSRPPLVLSAELLAARPLLRASVVLDLSLDGEFMLAYAIVDNAESARSPRQTGGGSSGDESVYVFRAFSLPPACELRAEFPLFESFDGSSGNDGDDGRGVFRASVGVPHLAIDMVQTDAGLIVFHAYDSEPANGIGTASAANRNEAQVHHITIVPNSSVLAATPNKAQSLFVSARASSVHSATLSSSSTSSASTFAMPPAKCDACSLCALCRGSRAGIAWHASFRSYAPHFRLTASSLLGSNPKSATPASAASASACANQWDASAAASASLAESAAASILPLHSSLVGTGSTNRGIRLMFNAGDAVHSAIVRLDCSQHDLALTAACPSAERCITSTTEADVQSSSLSAGVVPRGLLAGAFQRSEWLQVSPPRRQRCTAHSGSHCTHRHSPPSDSDSRVFRVEVCFLKLCSCA